MSEMVSKKLQRRKGKQPRKPTTTGNDAALIVAALSALAFAIWHMAPLPVESRTSAPQVFLLLGAGLASFAWWAGNRIAANGGVRQLLQPGHRSALLLAAAGCLLLTLLAHPGKVEATGPNPLESRITDLMAEIKAAREKLATLESQPKPAGQLSDGDRKLLSETRTALGDLQKQQAELEKAKKAFAEAQEKAKAGTLTPPTIVAQIPKPPAIPKAADEFEKLPSVTNDGDKNKSAGDHPGGSGKGAGDPATGEDKGAALSALAGLAAMAAPELMPVFMLLSAILGLSLGGTEVRDLPTVAKAMTEVFTDGEKASVEQMVKKLFDDTSLGDPEAGIEHYLECLADPVYVNKLGEKKAKELSAALRQCQILWKTYPNAMYYAGRLSTLDMLKNVQPLIEHADAVAFGEYGTNPIKADIGLPTWHMILREALFAASKGQAKKYEGGVLRSMPATDPTVINKLLDTIKDHPNPADPSKPPAVAA